MKPFFQGSYFAVSCCYSGTNDHPKPIAASHLSALLLRPFAEQRSFFLLRSAISKRAESREPMTMTFLSINARSSAVLNKAIVNKGLMKSYVPVRG